MRVIYVANHTGAGNDDEGAIAHALEQLGAEVLRIPERGARYEGLRGLRGDLLLFHGYRCHRSVSLMNMPTVCWYFDRVDDPDPSLVNRNNARISWARGMADACDYMFFTDGDWVEAEQHRPARKAMLTWLPQGADERVTGVAMQMPGLPLLMTASYACGGDKRRAFIENTLCRYRDSLTYVTKGLHGANMKDAVARSRMVIAPAYPIGPRYWSNRVYQAAGFGACVLHPLVVDKDPYISGPGYVHGKEIIYYEDEKTLYDIIDNMDLDSTRAIGLAAWETTVCNHLYRHRCSKLLEIVTRGHHANRPSHAT